jgi:acyl-coenzyme A synthetase/AMP-(fatty) acid ligase
LRSLLRTLQGTERLPDLRRIRIGGERIDAADVAAARQQCPDAELLINYSTTETGAIAIHPIPATATFAGLVPVGRPLDGITVRIVDDDGRALPAGAAGEIVVESEHLSSGYWNDPERTARSFTATDAPRVRAYRTGDLGRLRDDGLIEHLGRKDLRVKIRGFRIEIEEIETLLNQDPEVLRAAVAAKPDTDGDLRLVAYIQPVRDANTTVERLRARLSMQLPEHAIPSTFVVLETIPLTESGKIDRQRLPEIPEERPALEAPFVLPRTPLEVTVAEVWREVLGLAVAGVHDAFLAVGGDSLKATLVASRLAARTGREVPLSVMFEASTIAELAARLEGEASGSAV